MPNKQLSFSGSKFEMIEQVSTNFENFVTNNGGVPRTRLKGLFLEALKFEYPNFLKECKAEIEEALSTYV